MIYLWRVCSQTAVETGTATVENQYTRAVRRSGNPTAMQLISKVFEVVPQQWRGIGEIAHSGLSLQAEYAAFDAQIANVQIVTGDTKVVDKGKGDGIFINTAGVGMIESDLTIAPQSIQHSDAILLNGDIGRHGMAIMAVREGLEFETIIASDTAPLAELVLKLIAAGIEIHMLRDLTRGGLASALNEISLAANVGISIDENLIPMREDVQGACEILGFDPLYVANEGRFIAFIPQRQVETALQIMRSHPLGENACMIGQVTDNHSNLVTMRTEIGSTRIVDLLSGEQLPRIC